LSSASSGAISDATRYYIVQFANVYMGEFEFHQVRSSTCYHMDSALSYLPSQNKFDDCNFRGHTYYA
ncbi:8723_t:CDS:1, partial [Scutellospora calospora]